MDGLLRVDKPAGWTSHDAVAYVRRALGVKKAGHTGTLDPAATGLLLVLVGRATRLARYFEHDIKTYFAVMALGTETDTQDAEGAVVRRCEVPPLNPQEVKAALARFTGEFAQKPPMYSAVKVGGRPLYSHARAGREVERSERRVTVHSLTLAALEGDRLSLTATCSKGTYVRTLCRDIAEALGTCGHLIELRRTEAGGFSVEGAADLSARPSGEELAGMLAGMDGMLGWLPEVVLKTGAAAKVRDGIQPADADIAKAPEDLAEGAPCRLVGPEGGLIAVARRGGMGHGKGAYRLEVVLA